MHLGSLAVCLIFLIFSLLSLDLYKFSVRDLMNGTRTVRTSCSSSRVGLLGGSKPSSLLLLGLQSYYKQPKTENLCLCACESLEFAHSREECNRRLSVTSNANIIPNPM